MSDTWQFVVIGAGPAGMAAASLAARRGVRTLILDENPGPGGQVYRSVETTGAGPEVLGGDYERGRLLAQDLRSSGADYRGARPSGGWEKPATWRRRTGWRSPSRKPAARGSSARPMC
jgi:NADPH-dependent 2,4-dienoyl-CoA reductase/sulfur reductase-like enzyme